MAITTTKKMLISTKFSKFMDKYNKSYNVREKKERERIFGININKIDQHNSNSSLNFQLTENEWTDLTKEEFEGRYMGLNFRSRRDDTFEVWELCPSSHEAPKSSIDWSKDKGRRKKRVSPV